MIQRKCIATNKIKDVSEMIRIVKIKDGKFLVDSDAKGRGAYISKDPLLVSKLKKQKLLNRTFKTPVSNDVYDELIKVMEEKDDK